MNYRFYLNNGSSTTEVFPLNFLSTTLVDTIEENRAFYRREFSGTLMFVNLNGDDDFTLFYDLWQADPCTKLTLLIEHEEDYYWDGYFSLTDGHFDLDKCTFEVTPLPNDDYVDILDLADTQHNILSVPTVVTVKAVNGAINKTYTRNRWLFDVIEYIAEEIKTGVTVSSDFFTEAINPVSLNANKLLYLTIAQKSDILRPTSTDPAVIGQLSWNELMDILWAMFQVQWNYDPLTDTINVEHVSWFSQTAGLDLRTQTLCTATNKFTYKKGKMPKYENFTMMEMGNFDFIGAPIRYESYCVDQDPKTNSTEISIPITTDLEYIISSPDNISDEGFVILCNYENGGEYFVEISGGFYWNEARLNMHLSWANLHQYYFRHNRVLIEGFLNQIDTIFVSARKTILQDPFYAIVCKDDAYDPANYITTQLGETYLSSAKGSVDISELSPTGQMKFTLSYGPDDNVNTGVEDFRYAVIYEVSCGDFTIDFSEATTEDYDIVITHTIYDENGDVVCTDTETWTVPSGSTTDTFSITPCDSIPLGGWMPRPIFNTGALEGWAVSVNFEVTCYTV